MSVRSLLMLVVLFVVAVPLHEHRQPHQQCAPVTVVSPSGPAREARGVIIGRGGDRVHTTREGWFVNAVPLTPLCDGQVSPDLPSPGAPVELTIPAGEYLVMFSSRDLRLVRAERIVG